MEDKEVGALWRELTEGVHDQSLTNQLRRNKWKELIVKLVEERLSRCSGCIEEGDDCHAGCGCNTRFANLDEVLRGFNIDLESWKKYGDPERTG